MHGFLKKIDRFAKGTIATAGTVGSVLSAGKAIYDVGKVAAPILAGLL